MKNMTQSEALETIERPNIKNTEIDFKEFFSAGASMITMSPGQWDNCLQTAYDRGWVLLEVDEEETIVGAYHKAA